MSDKRVCFVEVDPDFIIVKKSKFIYLYANTLTIEEGNFSRSEGAKFKVFVIRWTIHSINFRTNPIPIPNKNGFTQSDKRKCQFETTLEYIVSKLKLLS